MQQSAATRIGHYIAARFSQPVTMYHGTSLANLRSVMVHGLTPPPEYGRGSTDAVGGVYFAKDPAYALTYARETGLVVQALIQEKDALLDEDALTYPLTPHSSFDKVKRLYAPIRNGDEEGTAYLTKRLTSFLAAHDVDMARLAPEAREHLLAQYRRYCLNLMERWYWWKLVKTRGFAWSEPVQRSYSDRDSYDLTSALRWLLPKLPTLRICKTVGFRGSSRITAVISVDAAAAPPVRVEYGTPTPELLAAVDARLAYLRKIRARR